MPLTLRDLETQLADCRRLGATGDEPVFLEGSVITGIEGLKITTRTRARQVALCAPATLNVGQIVLIWGVPEQDREGETS
ncbi:hypothetical protein [Thiobaca trueperi]|uniref:Uncharacterized protein n=1 Tax=Thiobaca trueperi TaxID=127458 RepID=A0A4R3MZ98_9GAMM|nr:hypothetical protein [Thiobaca trueperi]TCT21177.1 hypothetical protein EDC35_10430 [Thiobaca trueperi]